jgi:hypothetical protein
MCHVRVDGSGRIVIPMELRDRYEIGICGELIAQTRGTPPGPPTLLTTTSTSPPLRIRSVPTPLRSCTSRPWTSYSAWLGPAAQRKPRKLNRTTPVNRQLYIRHQPIFGSVGWTPPTIFAAGFAVGNAHTTATPCRELLDLRPPSGARKTVPLQAEPGNEKK